MTCAGRKTRIGAARFLAVARPFYVGLGFAMLGLGLGSSANAAEEAMRIQAKGLAALHTGRTAEALELFSKAIDLDGSDAEAFFYRGGVHGRLGDYAAAASDYARALELRPNLPRASFELGHALFRLERYDEALPRLEAASGEQGAAAQALLLAGIIEARRGRVARAQARLEDAAALDSSLAVAAQFYQGVAGYHGQRWGAAKTHFGRVVETAPDTEYGREARAYIETLDGAEVSRLAFHGGAAFEYDDNVLLGPSDGPTKNLQGISDENDFRFALTAGADFDVVAGETFNVAVGYEFYQTLHFDLDDHNIQDHTVRLAASAKFDPMSYGVLASYDYFLLKDSSLLGETTLQPWVSYRQGAFGRLEAYYRARLRDMRQSALDEVEGTNHGVGIRQIINLNEPTRFVSLGYGYDREDVGDGPSRPFAYTGHAAEAALGWRIVDGTVFDAAYAYRNEDYDGAGADGRRDDEHRIRFALSRKVANHVWLVAAYSGTINNSNTVEFDYDRHIGSFGVEVRP